MKRLAVILLAILLVGCQGNDLEIFDEKQNIVVEKQVGDEDEYEEFNTITDTKQVEEVRAILHDTHWKVAQVDFIRPPDYRFIYKYKNPNIDAKPMLHQIWISPKKDALEVMQGPQEYAQLPKAESARLFEILTGESLPTVKVGPLRY